MGYQIRKAAVIGAGTMGGGIAALLAGVGIPTLLLDIVPRELTEAEEQAGLSLNDREVRNRIVQAGWKAVLRSRPPSIMSQASKQLVTLGNLDDDFDQLADADWIIEVIVENLSIKQELFARIDQVRKEPCIVSTNTSGLLIRDIADGRSVGFKKHFLGTHFFNPPRWLKLLEIIPHPETALEVLDAITEFSRERLGKGVVFCKDTPNFIANRFLSITNGYAIAQAIAGGYSVEEVDAITGVLIGRPKTGTFRLFDLIGIDVGVHVSNNLFDLIEHDPWRSILKDESCVHLFETMLSNKWLGNKTKVGFYKRVTTQDGKKEFWPLDLRSLEHVPPTNPRFAIFAEGKDIEDLGARFRWIVAQVENDEASDETRRLAKYLWDVTSYAMGYSAACLPEIADNLVSVDQAIKWGFAHEIGPFEIWDALGVQATADRMEQEGIAIAGWVRAMLAAGCETFYEYQDGQAVGYFDFESKSYKPLDVDKRILPVASIKAKEDALVKLNASASLLDMGDGVGLIEFHSKANALDQDIFDMMSFALDEAEAGRFDALVIGNDGQHFCAGANVFLIWMAAQQEQWDQIDQLVKGMQDGLMRIRYFPKPVVAAPHGMVLGGGAELCMACAKRVAAAETFIGLVEAGTVGLIPAGTGTKEMMRRVINPVMRIPNADPISVMQKVFEQLAMAKVATGAFEAFEYGFFQLGDRVIMNKDYVLAEAKRSALAMVAEGYRPPAPERIYAGGRDLLAALHAAVWGLQKAGWATDHDALIANKLAFVLCGGELSEPTWVSEEYVLDLEREIFLQLCMEEKSQARIAYLLEHNKPLRN